MLNIKYIYPKVFCILGPTGIGKSLISMKLCEIFPFEIISVDSALVYKDLNIGVNKPSKDELKLFTHYLINIKDPKDYYSVNNFFFDIKEILYKIIFIRKKIPLLVGGTMMYYNVLFNGLNLLPDPNINIRKYINYLFTIYGSKYVFNILKNIDYKSSCKLHYNDKYRIMRYLEIYFITGKKISFLKQNNKLKLNYNFIKLIIFPSNISLLHKTIKIRFFNMLKNGFKNEVKKLYYRSDLNINSPFMKCIGYKQMWLYLDNKISYVEMINISINKTIYLVKKQLTWLKKFKNICFLFKQEKDLLKKIIYFIYLNLN